MRKLQRLWTNFCALPGIVRFGLGLALAILAMLALPGTAKAEDRIARQGADSVTISERPCLVASVLIQIDRLAPGEREKFQRADATFGGQKFFACWQAVPGGVHLIYEDGDQGLIPAADLKPVLGI